MSNFKQPFSKIKDISDRRRLPRLGKIRLGVKMISKKTGKEYPKETDYFVCPEEVRKIYGDQPKELDVMFPLNEVEAIFPQRYIWYGQSKGAKCIGDGEKANQVQDDRTIKEIECPCDKLGKECQRRAHLMVILPKVSLGGIYQIDLGSYHSIVDINSALSTDPENMGYIMALVGRIAMVPLKLKRIARETHGSGRKETHWTLQITFEGSMEFLSELRENTTKLLSYTIAPPIEENPATDEGAIMVEETKEPDKNPVKVSGEIESEPSEEQPPEHIADIVQGVFPGSQVLSPAEQVDLEYDKKVEAKIEELFGNLTAELMGLQSQTDIMVFMTNKAKKHKEILGEKLYQALVNAINDRLMEIARKHRTKK
jgi:hypothetical protein